MEKMTWKTKLIIAAIVVALVLAGCGIVSAMSFGSLLLALASLAVEELVVGMQNIFMINILKQYKNNE